MKFILFTMFCLFVAGAAVTEGKGDTAKAKKDILAEAFANMRAKTRWNLEGDMLWGFYFTNRTKEPLAPVAKQLEKKGYRVVSIYLDEAKENWWLHVEKVEIHSIDSLLKREIELTELAAVNGLGSYDGWDVGPVISGKRSQPQHQHP